MLMRLVRNELSRVADQGGADSLEEANDFDIEDEDFDDILTPYEEMGREPIDAGDASERDDADRNNGQAEPAGLRPGQSGTPAGGSGPETGTLDLGPVHDPAAPLPAAARETAVAPNPAVTPVQRRAVG